MWLIWRLELESGRFGAAYAGTLLAEREDSRLVSQVCDSDKMIDENQGPVAQGFVSVSLQTLVRKVQG